MYPHDWKLKGKWAVRAISAVWFSSVCYSGILHPIKTINARKPQILMTPELEKSVDSVGSDQCLQLFCLTWNLKNLPTKQLQ